MKYATPTYDYRGHRITLTPRVPEGVAAYCDGCLLTWTGDHDTALATAKVIIDRRFEERLRKLRVVNDNRMAGLGPPADEWGRW
jgi:hypothetical protein